MKIRRITLRLPAHLRHTAEHDARAVAEAMARELAGRENPPATLQIDLRGQHQTGAALAAQAAMGARKGGGHGG